MSTWPPPAASDRGVLLLASSQSTSANWCLAIRDCLAGSDKSDLLESSSYACKEFKVQTRASSVAFSLSMHKVLLVSF